MAAFARRHVLSGTRCSFDGRRLSDASNQGRCPGRRNRRTRLARLPARHHELVGAGARRESDRHLPDVSSGMVAPSKSDPGPTWSMLEDVRDVHHHAEAVQPWSGSFFLSSGSGLSGGSGILGESCSCVATSKRNRAAVALMLSKYAGSLKGSKTPWWMNVPPEG